jgi:replicative DNA helicase
VETSVDPGDFYNLKARELFEVLRSTHERHGTLDMPLVVQEYKDRGCWKSTTHEYLADVLARSGTVSNVDRYCEILRSKSLARCVLDAAWGLEATACDDALTDSARLSAVDDALRGIYKAGRVEPLITAGQAVLEHEAVVQAGMDSDGGITGLRTGLPTVDQATGGLKGGWQVVILADSGVGKSALALQIANLAARDHKRVVLFTLEMKAQEVMGRAISQVSGVSYQRQVRGQMNPDEVMKYEAAKPIVGQWPIHVDENAGLTLGRLAIRAKAVAHQHGKVDLVILDYLQLLTLGDDARGNRTEEIEAITRRMKRLARELDCVVITLSQPDKEGSKRGRIDHRDAKGAQSIGADVDLALCISKIQDERRIDGTKFRHGAQFYIPQDRLRFRGERMIFQEAR